MINASLPDVYIANEEEILDFFRRKWISIQGKEKANHYFSEWGKEAHLFYLDRKKLQTEKTEVTRKDRKTMPTE